MNAAARNSDTLFAQAIEIASPEERALFLEKACANDVELRREVEKLVRDHFRAGEFLARPAAHIVVTVDDPIRERPGTVIGPYKLLEEIGEGGMGLVFVAEQQQPIKRRVALKIIKPGMDSRQVIARFEAERQALAMMDHPHIAKVHDGGTTPEGRPYFVMELVKGTPITDYCDRHRLTNRQRLELFRDVCQAVQHAHQKGIIHRDLKPSNVLVSLHDVTPVVKVIDFGVAKAIGGRLTDKTVYTQLSELIGTPLYMSPEQAGLSDIDVDTRSDVYSLGVLLYELLTGTTPFDRETLKQAGYDEMRRMIREEEPPRPSTRLSTIEKAALSTIAERRGLEPRRLSQQVRGELDWIVMKALEKDRNRRYESASAFAADVQRYLDDEPVQACPPSKLYRLRKLVRRYKAGLSVAACLLVVLGVCAWLLWRDLGRRADAENSVQSALERADALRGEERWQEASAVLAVAQGQVADHGLGALRQRLEQARQDIDMIVNLEEARLQRSATAMGITGSSTERSLNYAGADWLYTEAFQRYGIDVATLELEEAVRRVRASAIRDHLTEGLDDWAFSRERNSDAAGGKALRSVARLADEDPWRQKLRDAVEHADRAGLEALAEQEDTLSKRPVSLALLGRTLRNAGSGKIAERLLRRAQAVHPGDFWLNYELAVTLAPNERPSFAPAPDWGQAVRFLQAALALRPQSASVYTTLGFALVGEGKLAEGEAAFRKAIALKPDDAIAHHDLGIALERQGKHVEAEAAFRKSIALKPDFALGYLNLSWRLSHQGKHAEAEAAYREYKNLDHDTRGHDLAEQGKFAEAEAAYRKAIALNPDNVEAHKHLGDALYYQGKLAEAEAVWRKGIALKPDDTQSHKNLGQLLGLQGKLVEAEAALRKAISLKPDDPHTHTILGAILDMQGKHAEAEAAYRKALVLRPNYALANDRLRAVLRAQGKVAESEAADREAADREAAYRQAIALNPDDAVAHNNLRAVLRAQGKVAEKEAADRAAEAAFRKAIARKPDDANAHHNLGVALDEQGKHAEAEAAYRKALVLQPNYALDNDRLRAVLRAQGKVAESEAADREAEAAYRKAILYTFEDAEAHGRLGHLLQSQGKLKDAIASYRDAAGRRPDSVEYHHQLAWLLATCPDRKLRDPGQALEHAKKAVELAPGEGMSWKTLGVAQFRNGAWKEAIAALRKSVQLHKEGDSFDLFFLAMAHWQLDDKDKARDWYDRAVARMEQHRPQDKELKRVCVEAATLLGLAKAAEEQKQKE
jgi:serine/threonine protein kinase/tetratricopeptide (TPR) repeat protein